jgi:uncharacterized protein YyaL (SSP411 family)
MVRLSVRPNRAHLVGWREWGEAAFQEAAAQHKLVALFLTAFWCGICQRLDETTLSDDDVIVLLNAYFVPIRVDESERPDVDLRYTQNGWPTVVFLTAEGEAFLSVNMLDAEAFINLLVKIVDAHERQPALVTTAERAEAEPGAEAEPSAEAWVQPPAPTRQAVGDRALLTAQTVASLARQLRGLADPVHGGFGGPAKYLLPEANEFLLYLAETTQDQTARLHVLRTLDILVQRRIYDAADGGFFRYSSQPDWNEPHREKLLADESALLRNYLDAFLLTEAAAYRTTAERLIAYLESTLAASDGPLFWGCQDFIVHPLTGALTSVVDRFLYCDANARTASAYFESWWILGDTAYRHRAEQMLAALWATFRAPEGGLYHYVDDAGQPRAPGLLADSLYLGQALLDGYRISGTPEYLEDARQLGLEVLRMHLNPTGGLSDISAPGPAGLRHPVTVLAQNAIAAGFFLHLAEFTLDRRFRDAAQWSLLSFSGSAEIYGAFAASFGHALGRALGAPARVTVTGPPGSPEVRALARAARSRLACGDLTLAFRAAALPASAAIDSAGRRLADVHAPADFRPELLAARWVE